MADISIKERFMPFSRKKITYLVIIEVLLDLLIKYVSFDKTNLTKSLIQ